MKNIIILLSLLFSGNKIISQVVFCPPGAEWHFLFNDNNLSLNPNFVNERIKYTGDTVLANETVKVLRHTRFYKEFNDFLISRTYLKQNGDTVFMKNSYTNNQWQVLYNFGVSVGQGWYNSFSGYIVIDSINYINVNGYNLKHLYYGTKVVAERLGNYEYLFDFKGPSSDGDGVLRFLCYQDNTFGLKQFSSLPCTYTDKVGISPYQSDDTSLGVFPNPTKSLLTLEFRTAQVNTTIKFFDVSGKELPLDVSVLDATKASIDLTKFESGIYFLHVYEKGNLKSVSKVLKN